MHYHFKIHEEKDGFWAECVELDGCFTQAKTRKALANNMAEALNLFLDERPNSKHIFPLPKMQVRGKNIVKVEVDSKVALAMLTRTTRLKNNLTQAKVAEKMGVGLYSFQRLESSKSANPRWETITKLFKALPGFPIELFAK